MIIRSEKKGNYTILPNEFLLDDTISDKARGLLARLLCRPDNWALNVNHLVKTGKAGHTSVRSALRELEDVGYICREVSRNTNGRIIGIEYIVRDHIVCVNEVVEVQDDVDHFHDAGEMVAAHEDHADDHLVMETRMRKTQNKGTAPIINTETEQILKETTTTAQDTAPVVCARALPSSPYSNLEILKLIPEQHRSPMVVTFVNKAIVDYPENELKNAVAYASVNVRGGSMQFRAYLDKTLKNKWADGCSDLMQAQRGCLHHHDPETVKRHGEGRAWLKGLELDSVRMLANSGNVAAADELKRRESDGLVLKRNLYGKYDIESLRTGRC